MPTEYSELVNLFIDLRGRGVSLSTIDLDILQSWEKNNLGIEFIAKIMFEISVECKTKNKNFPNTLEPISRKLNKILLKMRET
ncbi:MAG: hypothetical protein V4591_12105 [Bdellovibrionota bacterium]